jgi:hypothetical protein
MIIRNLAGILLLGTLIMQPIAAAVPGGSSSPEQPVKSSPTTFALVRKIFNGEDLWIRKDYMAAKALFLDVIETCERQGLLSSQCYFTALAKLASIEEIQNLSTLEIDQKIITLFELIDSSNEHIINVYIKALCRLGNCYRSGAHGLVINVNTAIYLFHKAIDIARRLQNPINAVKAHMYLAEIYKEASDLFPIHKNFDDFVAMHYRAVVSIIDKNGISTSGLSSIYSKALSALKAFDDDKIFVMAKLVGKH